MNTPDNNFDPLQGVAKAPASMPEEMRAVDFRTLSPYQRALLVTDGTVTKFIESYTLEPLEIIRVTQEHCALKEGQPWLEVDNTTDVIVREVIICGRNNHLLYVYAASHIVPERLPDSIRERLEIQGESIGRLLNDKEMETRREILWFGSEQPLQLPAAIRSFEQQKFISRVYRILIKGKPIMLINEKFPVLAKPVSDLR